MSLTNCLLELWRCFYSRISITKYILKLNFYLEAKKICFSCVLRNRSEIKMRKSTLLSLVEPFFVTVVKFFFWYFFNVNDFGLTPIANATKTTRMTALNFFTTSFDWKWIPHRQKEYNLNIEQTFREAKHANVEIPSERTGRRSKKIWKAEQPFGDVE